jgi:hypothetical protein
MPQNATKKNYFVSNRNKYSEMRIIAAQKLTVTSFESLKHDAVGMP